MEFNPYSLKKRKSLLSEPDTKQGKRRKCQQIDALKNLMALANVISSKLGIIIDKDDDVIDLEKSQHISRVLFAVFKCMGHLREVNAMDGSEVICQMCKQEIEIGTSKIRVNVLTNQIKMENPHIVFDYTVATQMMYMCNLFELRFTESKLIRTRKWRVKIGQYGLKSNHLSLLTGITYSGLAKIMGTLTLAIILAKHGSYNDNTVAAALRQRISHIERAEEIVQYFKQSPQRYLLHLALSNLGDLLNVCGDKSETIFAFPLIAIMKVLTQDDANYEKIQFTGPGGFFMYDAVKKFSYRIKSEEQDSSKIRQMIFHVVMGTTFKNIEVLAEMTDEKNWINWKDMKEGKKLDEIEMVVNLPNFLKYPNSDYPCVDVVKLNAHTSPWCPGRTSVFSGFRRVYKPEAPIIPADDIFMFLKQLSNKFNEKEKQEHKKRPERWSQTYEWNEADKQFNWIYENSNVVTTVQLIKN